MSSDHPLQWSTNGLRVRISCISDSTAHITPLFSAQKLIATQVLRVLETLQTNGIREIFTSALHSNEQRFFTNLGFNLYEELFLLAHNFDTPIDIPTRATRRVRRSDWPTILELDKAAFSTFWQFDSSALAEALAATPRTRARIATANRALGFAITGRSGRFGFLQRLAVDPGYQRMGVGRALVADALQWSRKRFVNQLLVNTQTNNLGALSLYESMGFIKKHDGLAVLKWNGSS